MHIISGSPNSNVPPAVAINIRKTCNKPGKLSTISNCRGDERVQEITARPGVDARLAASILKVCANGKIPMTIPVQIGETRN